MKPEHMTNEEWADYCWNKMHRFDHVVFVLAAINTVVLLGLLIMEMI